MLDGKSEVYLDIDFGLWCFWTLTFWIQLHSPKLIKSCSGYGSEFSVHFFVLDCKCKSSPAFLSPKHKPEFIVSEMPLFWPSDITHNL